MGYCTAEDLASAIADQKLAEFTAESGNLADPAVVAQVITKASAVIDRYLAARTVVPVTDATTLGILRPVCVDIIKFQLYGRRDLDSKDDPVRVQYDDAIKYLRDVAKGDVPLPPSAPPPAPATISDDVAGVFGSEGSVFTGGVRY